MALVTLYSMNARQKDLSNTVLATEGTPDSSNETEHLVIKVSELRKNNFHALLAIVLHAFVSDESCSCDFLLTLLYIYSNIIIMVVVYCSTLTYEHLHFR